MYDEREETRMHAALGLMMRTVYVLVRWRRKIRPTAYGATALVRVVEYPRTTRSSASSSWISGCRSRR